MGFIFRKITDFTKQLYYKTSSKVEKANLDELKYTVVDLETTGFYLPPIDRMIEIGAVNIENGKIVDEFRTYVNPLRDVPKIATEVTNISTKDVANAPKVGKALKEFFRFLGNNVLVAYNVSFDFEFIKTASRLSMGYEPKQKTLCAFELSKKVLYFLDKYDLDVVTDYFQIKIKDRHRALGDAVGTAELFIILLDILKKIGITTYSEAKFFETVHFMPKEHRELLEHYRRLGVI